MKKSLIALLMTAFCLIAFTASLPLQTNAQTTQDTVKKQSPKKSKKKSQHKKWPAKRDTTNRKPTDTTTRPM